MPHVTTIDRALIPFTLVSEARDSAITSLSVIQVEPSEDAPDARTKNRKTFTSWFFPVWADLQAIVTYWIAYLRVELLFSPIGPLFPNAEVSLNREAHSKPLGSGEAIGKRAAPIRQVFRDAFARAG